LDAKKERLAELEKEMSAPNFWDDNQRAREIIEQANPLRKDLENWNILASQFEDLGVLSELVGGDGASPSDLQELKKELETFKEDLEGFELQVQMDEEYDRNSAIVAIHPGAGGTESCDWAEMLMRMYLRWAEDHAYKSEILDRLDGDEMGIKSATFTVEGEYAYGRLRSERGVHRLVRVSPLDAQGRRHTSFASVDVIPEVNEEIKIDINPDDLRIDTYRSSGAGGQHVNKTSSAVRITHIPTGIVVQCQNERSQHRNRDNAMKVLRARLFEHYQREQEEKLAKTYGGGKKEIAWGSQIRSYVLHPYYLVKDHRTDVETSNAMAVLDGDIDRFIEAYLKRKKE